jgi:hypothetical protein
MVLIVGDDGMHAPLIDHPYTRISRTLKIDMPKPKYQSLTAHLATPLETSVVVIVYQ